MTATSPLLWLGALVTGLLIPLQLAFNAQLGRAVGSPFSSALIVALVMSAALALVTLASRTALPSPSVIATVPFTAWIGGLLAAFYIVAIVILTRVSASA
jgi:transporter family-2 protein